MKQKTLKDKAGIVVYDYLHRDEPLVLIITSRKFSGSWVFPVGTVEQGESLEDAAKRECVEEAGFYVDIESTLSTVEVPKGDITLRYTFFLATIVGEAATWETDREREWVQISKLVDRLPNIFLDVAREAVQRISQLIPK